MQDSPPDGSPTPPDLTGNGPPPLVPSLPPVVPALTEDERTMAMLCHLLGILTGFLGPLVLWLVKKDQSAFIDHHGREALNFQITLFLVMIALGSVTFVLMLLIIGFFLIPILAAVPVIGLILEILAAVAAHRGEWHRYPFNIRLV